MSAPDYEVEYNNRARVPEHPDLIAGWARDAAAWRERQAPRALRYGPGARHVIDLFPGGDEGPIVVFIHGGYWQALDGSFFSHLAAGLNAHGVGVAIPSYHLCPDVSVNHIIGEMREACRELAKLGRSLVVSGHSAGGHLTTMMLLTDWTRYGAPADLIKGGLSISGLYELEPVRLAYVNEALKLDANEARALSPIHHLPHDAGTLPPLLLAVGAAELPEFVRQQRDFAAEARKRNWRLGEIELAQHNHFSVLETLASREAALFPPLARLIQTGSVL